MEDLISRQTIIDGLEFVIEHGIETYGAHSISAEKMLEFVRELPTVQPNIVRCKDCKHWIPYDWMFSEVWQSKNIADYPEDEIGCDCSEMAMKANDFCSRAERREVTT